jgi:hypothetical protein
MKARASARGAKLRAWARGYRQRGGIDWTGDLFVGPDYSDTRMTRSNNELSAVVRIHGILTTKSGDEPCRYTARRATDEQARYAIPTVKALA